MPRNGDIDVCGPVEQVCVDETLHEHSADMYEDHIPGTICKLPMNACFSSVSCSGPYPKVSGRTSQVDPGV